MVVVVRSSIREAADVVGLEVGLAVPGNKGCRLAAAFARSGCASANIDL
jgi:hypothetical protein